MQIYIIMVIYIIIMVTRIVIQYNITLIYGTVMIKYCCNIVRVFLIGYYIFGTLLPECYYEAILLDVLPPNHHI